MPYASAADSNAPRAIGVGLEGRVLRKDGLWGDVSPFLLLLLWTGIGLAYAFAWYFPAMSEGKPVALRTAITWYLLDAYVWFALCPLLFFVQRRFPIAPNRSATYITHALLALGVAWLHFGLFICLDYLIDPAFPPRFHTLRSAVNQFLPYRTVYDAVIYSMIMAILFARNFYNGLRLERERRAAIEYQLTRSQLDALRMQLQPHFLFNSLHSVSALIEERPRDAIRMITKLGSFLRLTLEASGNQMVPLQEELRFLELYFEIEKIRLGDRVRFHMDIEPATKPARIPSLILQPLVENALKHGPWRETDTSSVGIVSRIRNGDSLEIVVQNEYEQASRVNPAAIQEGIGLTNVHNRMEQLYPGHFEFHYGWVSPGAFQVSLVMPLDPAPLRG